MEKLKKYKGITLISLVITVILLLILAGIAISQLSNSGIFEKSKEAKYKWQNAQNEENYILSQYEKNSYLNNAREYLNVKSDTYVGTGEAGSSHPSTLTFEQAPQMVIISTVDYTENNTCFFIQGCNFSSPSIKGNLCSSGTNYPSALAWSNNGKTLTWHSNGDIGDQMNRQNITYKWVAIF